MAQPPQPAIASANEELDFYSERFNPLLALYSSNLVLPEPRARPLDNLFKCRQLLPADHPDFMVFEAPGAKQNSKQELAKARTSYLIQKQQREESKRNPLKEIMEAITAGPLLLLKQACAERSQVRVVTRHRCGVRGTSTGTLVAFDKFMNMVLRDVEEEYTVLLNLGRERDEPGKLRPSQRKQERRHRSLKQVFVFGRNVVSVQRPPPKT